MGGHPKAFFDRSFLKVKKLAKRVCKLVIFYNTFDENAHSALASKTQPDFFVRRTKRERKNFEFVTCHLSFVGECRVTPLKNT